jgi:L-ascorbate metabolism protein UlaG (beta-lactamase superfamily)
MSATLDGLTIDWLGYATSRITDGERVVYLDPGRYGVLEGYDARDADLVLVTHDDHYDPDGIERVAAPDAVVGIFEGIRSEEIDRDSRPVEDLEYDVRRIGIGDAFEVDGIAIEAITAYNTADGHVREDGTPYHPEGEGVGYRLDFGDTTVFYPGDGDVVPEYEGLEADVFLAPIDDAFTMSPDDTAELAETIGAELVVPVHYDTFEALEADEEAFAEEVRSRGLRVEVLEPDAAVET